MLAIEYTTIVKLALTTGLYLWLGKILIYKEKQPSCKKGTATKKRRHEKICEIYGSGNNNNNSGKIVSVLLVSSLNFDLLTQG